MGKKLNADAILNELSGGSAFFPGFKNSDTSPTPLPATQPTQSADREILRKQPEQTTPERPNARTNVCPNMKRIITRNSFEIYEDQMYSLRELAYREKREGRIGS